MIGISKFGHELNGVCLRGIDGDCVPFSLSCCLNKMTEGVTWVDSAHEIIANVVPLAVSDSGEYD